jgi:MYXO-CTERM domain-containing protein
MLRAWLVLAVGLSLAAPAAAQTLFWNPATTSGNWNTTSTLWGTAAGGPFNQVWTNGGTAQLSAGGANVTLTLTEAISAGNLGLTGNLGDRFTIAAGPGGSLTLANGATIACASTGREIELATPILGAATLTFGTGTTTLAANNTFAGGITVQADAFVTIGRAARGVAGTLVADIALASPQAIVSFETSQSYGNALSGAGRVLVAGSTATPTVLTLTANQAGFTGILNVQKDATLRIDNNGTTTAGSLANAERIVIADNGRLDLSAHTASTFTVGAAQTLFAGSDDPFATLQQSVLGNLDIAGKLNLRPVGPSSNPNGNLRIDGGVLGFRPSSELEVNLSIWEPTLGPGGDYSQVFGAAGARLDLSAVTSSAPITLRVNDVELSDFNPAIGGMFAIANFSAGNAFGGIVDFDPAKFQIDLSQFGWAYYYQPGTVFMSVDAESNRLFLNFTPVPEPSAMALAGLAAAFAWSRRRRSRGT